MTNTLNDLSPILDTLFKEQPTRIILPNGLTVLLKEDHTSALTTAQVWVKTGSIHEDRHLGSGISHYVEHMLFKGTNKRSYKQITEDIHASGGQVNAYTTFDRTVYYIDTLAESTDIALDVLSDIVFNSKFDSAEVEQEQNVILREIDMGLDDPDHQVGQELFRNAFKKHPYKHPVIGVRDCFLTLNQHSLLAYYKTRYVPNNMVLVVTGDFESSQILERINHYFGSYKYQPISDPTFWSEPAQLAKRESRLFGDFNITRGTLAYKIPTLAHPDTPAIDILANILGQGASSVFNQSLREEQGLVFDISASAWNPGEEGLFWISYYCTLDKREAAEDAIATSIDKIANTQIDPSLIQKAIRQASVAEINNRKTISGQASRLGAAEVIIGDIGYPEQYLKRLSQVQPEDITRVLNKYLVPNTLTAITLEPSTQEKKLNKASTANSNLKDFELTTLGNGIQVILQHAPNLPKVSMRVAFKGSSLQESKDKRGITTLMSTLLTKDTQSRASKDIALAIESIGGSFGDYCGNNSFGIGLEILSQDIDQGLDILKESILHPQFTNETFETERTSQIASLEESMDEIVDYGRIELRKLFFGEHPFAIIPIGETKTLESLNTEDIKNHWNELRSPENMVIAVSGDFDSEEILNQVTQSFGSIPTRQRPNPSFSFEKPANSKRHERFMDREQAVVFQAYKDCGALSEENEAAEVLDELFSGLSSNLFTQVREEKGLAYYVGSSRTLGLDTGMFCFYAGTHPEHYEQVFEEISKEVKRVQSGDITEEEINRCKAKLKAKKRMSLQSPASRAAQASLDTLYGLPVNHWKTYSNRVDAVTKENLVNFANKYFVQDQALELVVRPKI